MHACRSTLEDPTDREGLVAAGLGLQGVPASVIIDAEGRIRHLHRGPLTRAVWDGEMLPVLRRLGL